MAVAHGRLVITGATGTGCTSRSSPPGCACRTRAAAERLNVGQTDAALAAATDGGVPGAAARPPRPRLVAARDQLRAALRGARRASARGTSRPRSPRRAAEERDHVAATLTELAPRSARRRSARAVEQLQLITGLELDAADRRQVERDRDALRERLDAIPGEIEAEQAAIDRRYADPAHRLFPAAVTLLVPEGARI